MATRRWRGDAVAIAQVDTLTPGGTIGTATFTMTINGKDVTYTATSGEAVAMVVAGLVAAWNASEIPEFAEITAVNSTTHVTLTHDTKGVPFTVTSSASGSATLVQATTTSATGPNHFDNADNWTGGAVPVDSDAVVFDSGNVSCKYGISQAALTPASLTITQGYTGEIGLPEVNVTNVVGHYREYRTKALTICASGDSINTAVRIGEGDGVGSGRLRLNFNTGQITATIINSGQRALEGEPAIQIQGTHASNEFNVMRGDVGFGFFAGETTTIATLRVGWINNQIGDARVETGSDVGTITTLEQSGGELTRRSATTTFDMTGGICHYIAGNITTMSLDSGQVFYLGTGTITTLNLGSGADIDFRRDMRNRTVTNANFYEGFAVHDPFGTVTWTNGIDFIRTTPADGTFEVPPNLTWTPSAI